MRWTTFFDTALDRTFHINLGAVVWATFTGGEGPEITFRFGDLTGTTHEHLIEPPDWRHLRRVLFDLEEEGSLAVVA